MHSSFEDYRLAGVGLASAAEQVNAPPFILNGSNAAAVAQTMQQLIDDLPEQIALLDEQCTILVTNRGWKEAVDQHGYRELSVGHNYRAFCAQKAAEGYEPAIEALAALEDIGRELVPIGSSHITEANVGAGAITKSVSTASRLARKRSYQSPASISPKSRSFAARKPLLGLH